MKPKQCDPERNCDLCPRLASFRAENRGLFPDWHNAPVDTWSSATGDASVKLLIVGLAPGLKGANRTARPFTGDYAGDLLYATLQKFDLAHGEYAKEKYDSLELHKTAITNAVRCVPPQNKPTTDEINRCRTFLTSTIARFKNLKCIITLGKIAHDSTLRSLNKIPARLRFGHGVIHETENLYIVSSYHCSRYNTNTGRLTEAMFEDVFKTAARYYVL